MDHSCNDLPRPVARATLVTTQGRLDVLPTVSAPFRLIPSQRRERRFTLAISAAILALGLAVPWVYPGIPWAVGAGICAAAALLNYGLATWLATRHGARVIEAGPGGISIERLNGTVETVAWEAVEEMTLMPSGVVFRMRGRRPVVVNTDGLTVEERARLDALAAEVRV